MIQLKVCGMKYTDNIKDLISIAPNFIGFIFHEASTRNCTKIPVVTIPESVHKVGVFVNKPFHFINDKIMDYQLDYVQLHGAESPKFCEDLYKKEIRIIKAFNISENFDFNQLSEYEQFCNYFLFDASGQKPGGNGIIFDWELLQKYNGKTPFLLSGGINDLMVKSIKNIKHNEFMGIDINSGFEIAPAQKNILKIKLFYHELQS